MDANANKNEIANENANENEIIKRKTKIKNKRKKDVTVDADAHVNANQNPNAVLEEQFNKCRAKISLFKMQINELADMFKRLEKQTNKCLKEAKKRKKQENIVRSSSSKPKREMKATLLSNDLCFFLGEPSGTEMSRADVNKRLFAYIKDKSLYNKDDKCLKPDGALTELIGTPDFKLTHFSIQKCMNKHYIATKKEESNNKNNNKK